jgi:hypothetical protein
MAEMELRESNVQLYWQYVADRSSPDRATRLAASETTGELWCNYGRITDCILGGGPDAAEVIIRLAAEADSGDRIAYLAAGPLEDLWYADCQTFLDVLLPRIQLDVAQKAVDGMYVSMKELAKIRAVLRSR